MNSLYSGVHAESPTMQNTTAETTQIIREKKDFLFSDSQRIFNLKKRK